MKKSKKAIIIFLMPAVILFVLTFIYPIIRTIVMSFFKIENMTGPVSEWQFTGVRNYLMLFRTPLFLTSVSHLLKLFFAAGAGVMVLALILSIILTSGIRGKKFFRVVIFMPYLISAVALGTMWQAYVFNNQYGFLKFIVKNASWTWLDQDHIFLSLMIAYSFGMVGYHMLIFMAGIEKIGPEYFEAATLDGAGKLRQFWYVTLPLLKGTFKTNIILWSVTSASFFTWSMIFGGGVSGVASSSVVFPMNYFYILTFGGMWHVAERNAGIGATIGILLGLFVLICFGLVNSLFREDNLEY